MRRTHASVNWVIIWSEWVLNCVISESPVTTESLVRFDTWFMFYGVLKKISSRDLRENGGEILERSKSKMAAILEMQLKKKWP